MLQQRAGGHYVVGGDLVADLYQHAPGQGVGQGLTGRGGDDGRTANDLHAGGVGLAQRRIDHVVVSGERFGRLDGGAGCAERFGERAGVGDLAGQRRSDGGFRRDEENVVIRRAGPAGEVAVEGPQADRALGRREALADARPAAGLQHASARGDQVAQRPVGGEHLQHLPAARGDAQLHRRTDRSPLEHGGDEHQVLVAGVRARADHHLGNGRAGELRDGADVVRAGRLSRQRLALGQVDHHAVEAHFRAAVGVGGADFHVRAVRANRLDRPGVALGVEALGNAVVGGARVGGERREDVAPPLSGEELSRHFVGRENAARGAQLGAHVRAGRPGRDGQRSCALAEVLHRAAHVAAGGEYAQQLEDDVLG